jgi:large subunit ribosomal protein L17
MRHAVKGRKLGRTTSHREAMFRNQLQSLVDKERIITTLPKAKELRPLAERLITRGKLGTVHARRWALRWLLRRDLVKKLFDDIAPRFSERPGGYLRIVKLGPRLGDGAERAVIEMVDFVPPSEKGQKGEKGAAAKGGGAKAAKEKAASKAARAGRKRGKGEEGEEAEGAAAGSEGEEKAAKGAKGARAGKAGKAGKAAKVAKKAAKPGGGGKGAAEGGKGGRKEGRPGHEPRGGEGRHPTTPRPGGRKPTTPQKTG